MVSWDALMQRQRHSVTHAPLLAVADIDVKPARALAIGCSRQIKRRRTIGARENFQGAFGLRVEKGGKKIVDSREYALIVLQKLLRGITVEPFLGSHEICKLLLLPLRKAHHPHAFAFDSCRDALHLSQANGVNFVRCVRSASVVLWRRGLSA